MQWLIDLALGRVKKASPDLRLKACAMVHERGYGKPAQNITVDIALKRAVEGHDPVEQLRILRDMRSNYVAQLEAPIEIAVEVLEEAARQPGRPRVAQPICRTELADFRQMAARLETRERFGWGPAYSRVSRKDKRR